MPVTRSELMFFAAGVAVGAFGHAAWPKVKESLAPFLAGASTMFGEQYSDFARTVAEKAAAVQEAMAEMAPSEPPRAGPEHADPQQHQTTPPADFSPEPSLS